VNIRTNFVLPESRVIGLHLRRYSTVLSFNFSWCTPKDARLLNDSA